MNKALKNASQKIKEEAKNKNLPLEYKDIDEKSCLIVNISNRKIVLMTINALDERGGQVLAFGISVRKSNWKSQLKTHSERELLGKLSDGAFKAIPLDKVLDFVS